MFICNNADADIIQFPSWESTYTSDLSLNETTPTHTGTNWFSDSNAEVKVVKYLDSLTNVFSTEKEKSSPRLTTSDASILDLGTGNGSLLFALRKKGWNGTLVGVDYSSASISLARKIALGLATSTPTERKETEEEGEESESDEEFIQVPIDRTSFKSIRFEEWDIMTSLPPSSQTTDSWIPTGAGGEEGFDIILDKGTFDAISLSSDLSQIAPSTSSAGEKRLFETYPEKVTPLLKRNGILLVTSCNWTEKELESWFCTEETGLTVVGRIQYPTFRFGGQTGQSVVSVCFRRR